ncbi:hypothetical protein B0H14DRAFT_3124643, partial [Mycena olivaceomarginata]
MAICIARDETRWSPGGKPNQNMIQLVKAAQQQQYAYEYIDDRSSFVRTQKAEEERIQQDMERAMRAQRRNKARKTARASEAAEQAVHPPTVVDDWQYNSSRRPSAVVYPQRTAVTATPISDWRHGSNVRRPSVVAYPQQSAVRVDAVRTVEQISSSPPRQATPVPVAHYAVTRSPPQSPSKHLAPIPRFNPFERARSESLSSLLDDEKAGKQRRRSRNASVSALFSRIHREANRTYMFLLLARPIRFPDPEDAPPPRPFHSHPVRQSSPLASVQNGSVGSRRRVHSVNPGPSLPSHGRPKRPVSTSLGPSQTSSHREVMSSVMEDSVFSDEYDLCGSPRQAHQEACPAVIKLFLDPRILLDVQRALKLKARREARLKSVNSSPSSNKSEPVASSPSPAKTSPSRPTFSPIAFPPPVPAPIVHESEPSTSSGHSGPRAGGHPVPSSSDEGTTLDWSGMGAEDDKPERRWT